MVDKSQKTFQRNINKIIREKLQNSLSTQKETIDYVLENFPKEVENSFKLHIISSVKQILKTNSDYSKIGSNNKGEYLYAFSNRNAENESIYDDSQYNFNNSQSKSLMGNKTDLFSLKNHAVKNKRKNFSSKSVEERSIQKLYKLVSNSDNDKKKINIGCLQAENKPCNINEQSHINQSISGKIENLENISSNDISFIDQLENIETNNLENILTNRKKSKKTDLNKSNQMSRQSNGTSMLNSTFDVQNSSQNTKIHFNSSNSSNSIFSDENILIDKTKGYTIPYSLYNSMIPYRSKHNHHEFIGSFKNYDKSIHEFNRALGEYIRSLKSSYDKINDYVYDPDYAFDNGIIKKNKN
ncbi:hypothetical protein EDEG_03162 [Edhazardia aedis USNM 41457]|uniref:Uncharacterized protein n=1 Tax=Edhazardia aedis (strain USNM 41457) TaxID=1003232 RepID=J9D3J2_EDHAE|nr:hypothetical protein EDEG_03162 [Edhazardia aedis USNM 41457]|eukprot:EJW02411.1 hypothetical protein EDEG_03162 [Edhazardia aedis USNM 41457]